MFRTNSPEPRNPAQESASEATPVYSSYQREGYALASADDASTPRAVAESAAIARDLKEGTLSAFVGGGTAITGDVSFKTMLRVDGRFSGRISSDEGILMVAAGGRVDANVAVAVARVQGTLVGDIVASNRIELGRSARVTGNIQAPSLSVEDGAVLDGSCRMSPLPVASEPQVAAEPEPAAQAVAFPVSQAESAIETAAAAEITAAAVSETVAGPEAAAETSPKVERKENVMGTRTRRHRTKAATPKAEGGEPVAKAATG
jgi:cytoskeletal protein CcmA (bactofilin family)